MGCASAREKIESKIMLLKLKKVDLIQEREDKIKEYQKMTGKILRRKPIPDYIIKDNSKISEENSSDDEQKNYRRNRRKNDNSEN